MSAGRTFSIKAVGQTGHEITYETNSSAPLEHIEGDSEYSVAFVPNALLSTDIEALHEIAALDTSPNMNFDRADDLDFAHDVWRIELSLSLHCPTLFEKVLRLMQEVDSELWYKTQRTRASSSQSDRFFSEGFELSPEIEYIVYDTAGCGAPPTIERHVDNHSVVIHQLFRVFVELNSWTIYLGDTDCNAE
jgi:hypothetical protein